MRKTAFNVMLSLALSFAGTALPREKNFPTIKEFEVKWTSRAAMPGELYAHAAARIGDKIHVIGGRGDESGFAGYHYVYDISENTWEIKENMPSGSSNLAAAAFGGKVYVFGGNEQPEKTLVYNPKTDQWTPLAPIPTPRQHINYSAVEAAGKIYLIGGVEKLKSVEGWQFTVSNRIEIFDPVENNWSEGFPLPAARQMPATAFIDGKIFVIGGSDADYVYNGNLEVFDIEKQRWQRKSGIPEACYPAGVAVVHKKIFVISGLRRNHSLSRLYVYCPGSDQWTYLSDIPVGVRQSQMVSYGNKLYIVGGAINEITHSSCIEGEIIEMK